MFSLDLNCLCQLQNGKGGGVLILKANMYINMYIYVLIVLAAYTKDKLWNMIKLSYWVMGKIKSLFDIE